MDGSFIKKIGAKGKGPGEYLTPSAFDINKEKKEIVIYDRGRTKLLYYDFEGNYKYSKKIAARAYDFVISPNDDKEFIFDTHIEKQKNWRDVNFKQYSITKTNKKGEIIASYIETNKAQNDLGYRSNYNLFKNDSIILFNIPFKNIVYKIDKEGVSPFFEYNINFHDFKEKLEKNAYAYFDNKAGYFLIDNMLLFSVMYQGGRENYVYNLGDKKLHIVGLKNDMLNFGFTGVKMGVHKNTLITYIMPEWYLNNKSYNSKTFANTRVQEIIKETKEGDNPIIVLSRFRK